MFDLNIEVLKKMLQNLLSKTFLIPDKYQVTN